LLTINLMQTVLDASLEDELRASGEIDLSRDEDSVTSLAVGQKKGKATLVYAGINSSPQDVQKGKNEHFRVFGIESSRSRAAGANTVSARISELARGSLFSTKDADTYQRVLRLSAAFPGATQIGAVATGLAKDHQLALFDVSPVGSSGPKPKGTLSLEKEASDLDIIQTGDDQYQVAYCDDYELHVIDITKSGNTEPKLIYTIPHDHATGGGRPAFRCIRYMTSNFIMAVANLPKRSGVVLQGIRLHAPGQEKGRLAITTRLPKAVAQATGLAVRNLSPPATPSAKSGDAQFLVAVAGHDSSISLYTVEYRSSGPIEVLVDLLPLYTLKEVHPLNITGIALSVFPPSQPNAPASRRRQSIKLASVSMGNTVAVHSIPLRKFVDSSRPVRKGMPPRAPRYVVDLPANRDGARLIAILVTVVVVLLAIAGQAYLELYGHREPYFRIGKYLSPWGGTSAAPANDFMSTLLSGINPRQGESVVLREEPISPTPGGDAAAQIQVDIHDEQVHGAAMSWEDLSAKQKELWKKKLKNAGHWAEQMGEGVFKGILFGELAGAVRHMAGG
jgi:hypothetical protein